MCDIETLRLFVNERLSAVAEDILAVFVRTIVQYQQQIDVQHRHGVTSDLADVLHPPVYKEEVSPEQQMSSSPFQEEPESPHIKEEHKEIFQRPEGADVSTMTLLPVKSEHNDRETEPLASTSTEHTKTQADVEYCGTSQPASDVQLLSSECDTEDSDEWEQTREDQPALNAVKSHKAHAVGGQRSSLSNKVSQDLKPSSTEKNPFSCTVCGKRFNQPGNLKMHMRMHRVSGQDQSSDGSSPWGQTASWQSGPQEGGLAPPSIPNSLIPGSPASAAMVWRVQEVDAGSPSSQPSGMPTPLPQRHISVLMEGERPKIEKCSNSDFFKCPFCKYKAAQYMVHYHIIAHASVKHREFTIIKCGLNCRTATHFHCCYCPATIVNRAQFLKHLELRHPLDSHGRPVPEALVEQQHHPPEGPPPPPPPPPGDPPLDPPPPTQGQWFSAFLAGDPAPKRT